MYRVACALLMLFLCTCVWATSPHRGVSGIEWTSGTVVTTEHFRVVSSETEAQGLDYYGEVCESVLRFMVDEEYWDNAAVGRIEVMVCLTSKEFQDLTGQSADRTLAVAFTGSGRMALNGEALKRAGDFQRRQTIGHELVHLFLGQIAEDEVEVPYWLHEGLAQLLTGDLAFAGSMRLAWANVRNRRIPMVFLTDEFPYGKAEAELAYMQSADFTRFVLKREGFDSAKHFFGMAMSDPEWTKGIFKVWGDYAIVRMYEDQWTDGIHLAPNWLLIVTSSPLLWIGIVVLFLLAYLRKRRRARLIVEGWEPREQDNIDNHELKRISHREV